MVYKNYLTDHDITIFILKHLYRDIPEDPNSPVEYSGGNSKEESGYTGLTLEMLIENEGSGSDVICSRVAVG